MKVLGFLLHRFYSFIIIKSEWSGPKRNTDSIFPKYEWNGKQRLTGGAIYHKFIPNFNFTSLVFSSWYNSNYCPGWSSLIFVSLGLMFLLKDSSPLLSNLRPSSPDIVLSYEGSPCSLWDHVLLIITNLITVMLMLQP